MVIRLSRLLLAFAFGLGCSVVFTFPSWSSGTVRGGDEGHRLGNSVAKLRAPSDPEQRTLPRIIIETKSHTVTIAAPGQSPVVMRAQGAYALKVGSRTVVGKEINPVWKAPPTYFLRRGLEVPSNDSPSRFLRGALGHKALVLDGAISVHSGPIWSDDVGGVRVSPEDMAFLFEMIPVGATVDVV